MPKYQGKPLLMETLDAPLYFIKRLGDRQFVVGGGGGSSKTGVPNSIFILTLTVRKGRCYLRQSQKVDVGSACPMNAAVYELFSSSRSPLQIDGLKNSVPSPRAPSGISQSHLPLTKDNARELVAIGLDNKCLIYQVVRSLPKYNLENSPPGINHIQTAPNSQHDLLSLVYRETVETIPVVNGMQNCCVFLPPETIHGHHLAGKNQSHHIQANLATGGSDGLLKIWKGMEITELFSSIKAHTEGFEDMDLSASGDELITCGKDKTCSVWNLKSGKKTTTLIADFPEAKLCQYRPRKARFHSRDPSVLYVIWIPVVRQKKRPPSSVICIYRFRSSHLILVKSTTIKGDWLCALASSPDGNYVAVGNLEGDVHIFRGDSLALIYSGIGAHETFVTGLEFTDCTFGAKVITQTENAFCTVFSVSADRKIMMHQADIQYGRLRAWKKWMKVLPLLWLLVVVILHTLEYIGYITFNTSTESNSINDSVSLNNTSEQMDSVPHHHVEF